MFLTLTCILAQKKKNKRNLPLLQQEIGVESSTREHSSAMSSGVNFSVYHQYVHMQMLQAQRQKARFPAHLLPEEEYGAPVVNGTEQERSLPKAPISPNSPSPVKRKCDEEEASTPQVLKKLKTVICPSNDCAIPTPREAAVRILQWVAEVAPKYEDKTDSAEVACETTPKSDESPEPPKSPQSSGRLALEHLADASIFKFGSSHADQAAKAVKEFQEAVRKAVVGHKANSDLTITFVDPVAKPEVLAKKVEQLNGKDGPKVEVQLLKEQSGQKWKRPPSTMWFAETKGDNRLLVISVHLPGSQTRGAKRPQKLSFQLKAASRQLLLKGKKQLCLAYAVNLVMLFGRHEEVKVNTASSPDLSAFWAE